jgi:hypothetical protein
MASMSGLRSTPATRPAGPTRQQREVGAGPAGDVEHRVSGREPQPVDGSAPVGARPGGRSRRGHSRPPPSYTGRVPGRGLGRSPAAAHTRPVPLLCAAVHDRRAHRTDSPTCCRSEASRASRGARGGPALRRPSSAQAVLPRASRPCSSSGVARIRDLEEIDVLELLVVDRGDVSVAITGAPSRSGRPDPAEGVSRPPPIARPSRAGQRRSVRAVPLPRRRQASRRCAAARGLR